MTSASARARRVLGMKMVAWLALSTPLTWGLYRWFLGDGFGFDPVQEVMRYSGLVAVWVLISSLAVTPLRRWTGANDLQKLRRLIGLWAFAYAVVHFSLYLSIDRFFEWDTISEDLTERPFLFVGFAALMAMVPLAITSTKGWIRRLGKRWVKLHRLVYLSAGLAMLHFWWGQKADLRNPIIAGTVLAILLGARAWWAARSRMRS